MAEIHSLSGPAEFGGEQVSAADIVDHVVGVRRCSEWQHALPDAEIVFPARLLAVATTAQWVKDKADRGLCVGVRGDQDLDLAVSAGVPAARMVFHCAGAATGTVWNAVAVGVGRFIVGTERQMMLVSACAPERESVLVDVTGRRQAGDLLTAVLADEGLELIGLHLGLDNGDRADQVKYAIEQMARFSREHVVAMSRLSLAVSEPLSASPQARAALVAAVDDAIDSTCRRLRFARPALIVSPHWPTIPARRRSHPSAANQLPRPA
jgi:Pyridoxal-dependent decarboxylase, pyridoxal binding domain